LFGLTIGLRPIAYLSFGIIILVN